MILADIAQHLRDTSSRYGGIKDHLQAAGELDRATSEFFKRQDTESLAALNGAVARCERLRNGLDKPREVA